MTGISNGGYLTRWQLENRPDLYDGGVDWEGTLLTPDGPNLFTYLPTALREYPPGRGGPGRARRMYAAGFPPGSEVLWTDHYADYWDLTQRIYREAFDPGYDGATKAGTPFCKTGTARDADRVRRPLRLRRPGRRPVHDAVASVSPDRPDRQADDHPARRPRRPAADRAPTPTSTTRMIDEAGRGSLHRYYRSRAATTSTAWPLDPDQLRPILPCYRTAFDALTAWVEDRQEPPASRPCPVRPATGPPTGAAEHLFAGSRRPESRNDEAAPSGWTGPLRVGAPSGTRTPNPLIKSQLLCQLS